MKILPYLLPFLLVFGIGCSTQEESVSFNPALEIVFGNDSVSFDTLLSNRRSTTKRLLVYNRNQKAIQFSNIELGLGNASDYSVIINGKDKHQLFNEKLFGGDSLLILVEVNIDPEDEDLPYVVKDSIIFEWNGNTEHVKLVSWGQDGNSLKNQVVCDVTWTSDRPYIIQDTLLVQPGCQLTIEKGTKIFFENDAVMFIQGTLNAVGDSAEHIQFTNARFDGIYDKVPGQWNGIYFLEGSTNNQISFADIFNGQIGLRVGIPDNDQLPDVEVTNTTIYNMGFAGILAFTSDMNVTNSLIYNCGTYLVANFAGGNYNYKHCTFTNEPSVFIRDQPSVQFTDNFLLPDELLVADLQVEMTNCIVWGGAPEELLINNGGNTVLDLSFENNIIRSEQDIPASHTSQDFNFPGFSDPFSFDYSLDTLAFAQNKGSMLGVKTDITGGQRDDQPDIGAFEKRE